MLGLINHLKTSFAKLGSDLNNMVWLVPMKSISTEPDFKPTMLTAGSVFKAQTAQNL